MNDMRLTLRLPKKLHQVLKQMAQDDLRSLNAEILLILDYSTLDFIQDKAGPGAARQGEAGHGLAGRGQARRGRAGPGGARQGKAGQGKARRG